MSSEDPGTGSNLNSCERNPWFGDHEQPDPRNGPNRPDNLVTPLRGLGRWDGAVFPGLRHA